MYLHRDRMAFKGLIEQAADHCGRTPAVVEKDYYVTLILRLLAGQLEQCVFKGGTSLSKGFRVIDRFSEDIDITFDEYRQSFWSFVIRLFIKRITRLLRVTFCQILYPTMM